ncbi:peptidylprolyl isomerase [Candidatus Nitronereus thalassa]|uniref:Peptidyl-prolyl cis-trans isomerase n=1 Tax=Candidatus Nitronereus thalassa TaxID=3020898 RepID=A0ABU3K7I6_9BACT|nr:peptidylprolyl isomerase [Candidatus Nitronereus thalassa]MDT7042324.1 peptidylprolyl isomerase [Candidatus Nitronereus thalassa]
MRKSGSVVRVILSILVLGILVLLGSGQAWANGPKVLPVAEEKGKAPRVLLKTKFGEMEIVFFPELAPKHVESFLTLAKKGFYNGTIFHRVIPGFMIQGGDPNTKDPGRRNEYGTGGPGYTVPAEFNKIPHERGILSAARTADPNSAGSQFFIMVAKSPHLDGQYTVFGEVVKGIEVADKIVSQPRDRRDMPLERIEITVEVME